MANEQGPMLDQVNLVVRDMEAMVAFYRRLGLDVQEPPAPWGPHHRAVSGSGGMDLDLDSSAFAAMWNQGWSDGRTGAVITFRVPDRESVDSTYEELTGAGYAGQQPPYDAFWGARFAIVEDPDGNSVGLMSPADPDHRSSPPEPPSV
jgi:catechol 2,3-dioxygenase-like lactoylglutathione lyase family enzyme